MNTEEIEQVIDAAELYGKPVILDFLKMVEKYDLENWGIQDLEIYGEIKEAVAKQNIYYLGLVELDWKPFSILRAIEVIDFIDATEGLKDSLNELSALNILEVIKCVGDQSEKTLEDYANVLISTAEDAEALADQIDVSFEIAMQALDTMDNPGECYAGEYSCAEDFGKAQAEAIETIPDNLEFYFDFTRYGEDLAQDFHIIDDTYYFRMQ